MIHNSLSNKSTDILKDFGHILIYGETNTEKIYWQYILSFLNPLKYYNKTKIN